MKNLKYTISIDSTPGRVWEILWNKETYKQWTRHFQEGSYMEGEIEEGQTVQFLTPEKDGMTSLVEEVSPPHFIAFRHTGIVIKGAVQPAAETSEKWTQTRETYRLTPEQGGVLLEATVDMDQEYEQMMNEAFPKALEEVKKMAEQ